MLGHDLADHDIAVGDGERPSAPVTGRTRVCTGGLGADTIAAAVKLQDRSAPGGYRVDEHHRGAHTHAGHLALECALILAVEVRDVGRGASHVETDDLAESSSVTGTHRTDDPGRRTRKDAVLSLKEVTVYQTAV